MKWNIVDGWRNSCCIIVGEVGRMKSDKTRLRHIGVREYDILYYDVTGHRTVLSRQSDITPPKVQYGIADQKTP